MRMKGVIFGVALCLATEMSMGCSTIANGVGSIVSGGYTVARGALMVYRDGYQTAVLDYGKLPYCANETPPADAPTTTSTICRKVAIWQQLKAIDAAATSSIDAANKAMHVAHGDVTSIGEMMTALANAEVKITALGIKPHL